MSHLRTQLARERAAYHAVRYPGDLANDVLANARNVAYDALSNAPRARGDSVELQPSEARSSSDRASHHLDQPGARIGYADQSTPMGARGKLALAVGVYRRFRPYIHAGCALGAVAASVAVFLMLFPDSPAASILPAALRQQPTQAVFHMAPVVESVPFPAAPANPSLASTPAAPTITPLASPTGAQSPRPHANAAQEPA